MENKDDKSPPPQYENVTLSKRVSLVEPIFVKEESDHEPTEKDKLADEEVVPLQHLQPPQPVDPFDGDPALTVEGQVMFMTNSKRSLANLDPLRRVSTVSNKALGWKRYLGVIYTLLSTNMFSLSSNLLKLLGHVNALNLGCFAFPMGAVLSVPFIWYTLKIEKKPVTENLLPLGKHKRVVFFMWVRFTVSTTFSLFFLV